MLAEARGYGANMSAEMHRWLVENAGKVRVCDHANVIDCGWCTQSQQWRLEVERHQFSEIQQLECDFIWLATGTEMNFTKERCVHDLVRDECVPCHNGLPILNPDLSLPLRTETLGKLFVMGAYAALELGPGALNLMGARQGGCRIAHSLKRALSVR